MQNIDQQYIIDEKVIQKLSKNFIFLNTNYTRKHYYVPYVKLCGSIK